MRSALWALCVLGAPVAAQTECRLALAVALDVSSSVDAQEDLLQRGGTARALLAPEVEAAFLAGPDQVAIAVYEWSGRYNQELLVDWTIIRSRADLTEVARKVETSKRSHNDFPTAMGYALGFGAELLKRAPDCAARTIDMAGDGQNNEGFGPAQAYNAFSFEGVTVNGLVVNGADFEAETGLIAFYKSEVIRGPASFVEIANGFEDYERAMRRKLEREVSPPVFGRLMDAERRMP